MSTLEKHRSELKALGESSGLSEEMIEAMDRMFVSGYITGVGAVIKTGPRPILDEIIRLNPVSEIVKH